MQQNYDEKVCINSSNLMRLQQKNRKIKKDYKIQIDISKTEYPLLKAVSSNELGWRIWTKQWSKQEINLFWVDTYVTDQQVKKMKTYQKINHIPGSENLGKKNLLSSNINRMKKKSMNKDYNFYPATFVIPADTQQLQKFEKSKKNQYYIVKPCSDSQGRGIYLGNYNELNTKQELIIQQYIDTPLLIDKMKFDLRIYVLLKSISPLKIYVYEQGLCRLATCEYEKPSSSNKKNMKMHLTNYAINKLSPNFIFNKSEEQDNIGHKRSLSAAMNTMRQMGCDIAALSDKIDIIIVKTILSSYQILQKKYKDVAKEHEQSLCFEILGFDILIKDNFEPILLQVNHSPSFCTETPLDLTIKKYLILDTLNLLNFKHEDKVNYFKTIRMQNEYNNNLHPNLYPLSVKTTKITPSKDIQAEELGAYRKIFPLDTNIRNNESQIKIYDEILKSIKLQKLTKYNRLYNNKSSKQKSKKVKIQQDQLQGDQMKWNKSMKLDNHDQIDDERQIRKTSFEVKKSKQTSRQRQRQLAKKRQEELNLFDATLHINDEFMRKEMISFERRLRKQRKIDVAVVPMPLNSIDIKLDEKYSHRQSKPQSIRDHFNFNNENPYKIHSFLNSTFVYDGLHSENKSPTKNLIQRFKERHDEFFQTKRRQQLNKTNYSAFVDYDKKNEIKNRKMNQELQVLKQKLERGNNFTSVVTSKIRKNGRGHYIVVRTKSKQERNKSYERARQEVTN